MKADPLLPLYREQYGARAGRDRLGLLTALIDGPAFDPLFRGEVIRIPARHPVFRWACLVAGCERPRKGSLEMCHVHYGQQAQAQARGKGMAAFLAAAQPLGPSVWVEQVPCRICPGRPATHTGWRLCHRHYMRWYRCQRSEGQLASFGNWLAGQVPFDGYGPCQVAVCPDLAATPLGLCAGHESRYQTQGRPGGAALPPAWSLSCPAFSGQGICGQFTLLPARSGTRPESLAESGTRAWSGDESYCSGARSTAQYHPLRPCG